MTIDEFQYLSLATISKLTKKPLSSWSRWVQGRNMNAHTLTECCQRLSMSSDDFLKALEMRKDNRKNTVQD
jgi:hypothetical protein